MRRGKISTTIAPCRPSAIPIGTASNSCPPMNPAAIRRASGERDVDQAHRDDRQRDHQPPATHAVRQPAAQRFRDENGQQAQRIREEAGFPSFSAETLSPFDGIGEGQVLRGVGPSRRSRTCAQSATSLPESEGMRGGRMAAAFSPGGSLVDAAPQQPPEDAQRHARDERNAPAPVRDGFGAEGPIDEPGRS